MTGRELVRETLEFDAPERIPRHCWVVPWAEAHYPDAVKALRKGYPDDIVYAPAVYRKPPQLQGSKYAPGLFVDEWGCRFHNMESGLMGLVTEPRIGSWDDLDRFKTPDDVLTLDREAVNAFCRSTDRFVIPAVFQRPFERLQFLRTMEQALIDCFQHPPEFMKLLGIVHEHYVKEVECWASTDVDGIYLMDDWGHQQGLIISPELFRQFFKPLYREYAEIAHARGKFVFMHSDGKIDAIIPDLIEIGIDALNSQIFCMGVETLGREFAGRLTFWGEIDRQILLARGSVQEVAEAVDQVHAALYRNGGIIAQCEFGPGAKPINVFTVFEKWDEISNQVGKRLSRQRLGKVK